MWQVARVRGRIFLNHTRSEWSCGDWGPGPGFATTLVSFLWASSYLKKCPAQGLCEVGHSSRASFLPPPKETQEKYQSLMPFPEAQQLPYWEQAIPLGTQELCFWAQAASTSSTEIQVCICYWILKINYWRKYSTNYVSVGPRAHGLH